MGSGADEGVQLPEGRSGSSFLHALLRHGVEQFPEVFAQVELPSDAKRFRDTFATVLPRFEAARIGSPRRTEIARAIRCAAGEGLRFVRPDGTVPFEEEMRRDVAPLPVTAHPTRGPGVLRPSVSFRGTRREGAELRDWVSALLADGMMTQAAHDALQQALKRAEDGALSLRGHRFALLGAGAELAPTELLLAAGADVLWIDLRSPPASLLARDDLGGTLHVPEGPSNLLAAPAEILATVRAFAASAPVHLGMYAYAGGAGQEWRLTASMNAILRCLSRDDVRSMSLLVSPTTANAVTAEDRDVARRRMSKARTGRRLLRRLGWLRGGHEDGAGGSVVRSIVSFQGASYQAAQYVGKVLAAEAHATYGARLGEGEDPMRVSANVAPITATRSLSHPVFEAGFLGAPRWGILISEPATTRHLAGLLTIQDLTCAEMVAATPADRARTLFSRQLHGGVGTQPYEVIDGIKFAAIQGLMQKPSLIGQLVKSLT